MDFKLPKFDGTAAQMAWAVFFLMPCLAILMVVSAAVILALWPVLPPVVWLARRWELQPRPTNTPP